MNTRHAVAAAQAAVRTKQLRATFARWQARGVSRATAVQVIADAAAIQFRAEPRLSEPEKLARIADCLLHLDAVYQKGTA